MGEGLLYSKSSGGLIYYGGGEGLLYDTSSLWYKSVDTFFVSNLVYTTRYWINLHQVRS